MSTALCKLDGCGKKVTGQGGLRKFCCVPHAHEYQRQHNRSRGIKRNREVQLARGNNSCGVCGVALPNVGSSKGGRLRKYCPGECAAEGLRRKELAQRAKRKEERARKRQEREQQAQPAG